MKRQLRFVGVGGQGVILAGEILAAAKIEEGGYGVKASRYFTLTQTRARSSLCSLPRRLASSSLKTA